MKMNPHIPNSSVKNNSDYYNHVQTAIRWRSPKPDRQVSVEKVGSHVSVTQLANQFSESKPTNFQCSLFYSLLDCKRWFL